MRGINIDNVSKWLAENIAGAVAPFQFQLLAGGRSNLTYRVAGGDGSTFVLRRPPLGNVLATAHDMAREFRIITAVGTTNVPVPAALGLCTDPDINDAPFYVMTFIDGVVLDSPDKAALIEPQQRIDASMNLVDVLVDLHAVDVDAIGLGDLARREGYVDRQVRRWSTQWNLSKTRELPAIDEVARLLAAKIPTQHGVAIAHGDFRFGNCMLDVSTGRTLAVLDWELCTLGDPLADLGYMGVYWFDGHAAHARANDPTPAGGFASYDDVLQRYAVRSGRDISMIDYYVAFSCWRLAVISEGVYARFLHGAMGDDQDVDLEQFAVGTDALAERALRAMRRLS